ncbi:Protein croquemort [Orchesella cincta]|uniref:Protein croquemort n=1 Tax=Orchesella cincta TaxID=48709 RepID=A0A1D2NCL7_ORCCI|nr:Protein croquemort [Orchesella cincta]
MTARQSAAAIAATVAGVVFSVFGTFMYVLWPSIFNSVLNSRLILAPGSSSFGLWEVTPIPMYIEFYLFNWTNADDVYDVDRNISKPKLVELGPFVFREHRKKVIKEWCDDNSTITFLQNRTWYFEPELSKGSLDDLVTTVNVPGITAAFALRDAGIFYKFALAAAMAALRTKVHTTKTVREFIFDGYSDPLLNLASIVPASVVPVSIPFDKFGWFYSRNGSATYDGVFNMYTGVSDISKFGKIGEWNYMNHTHFYDSYCGKVNGSAGEFFNPYQDKSPISLFSSDVCRTLTLSYKEPTVMDGISGSRYWGDDTMFDNKTTKPDNWCFCPSGDCPPNGAIDVSSCKFGAPAFISFPHFFHGDPSYREAVDGMHPNPSFHQLFIDIEPRSGIPLQVSAALQINILVERRHEYGFLKNLPFEKIYFPCIWFRQTAQIDESIGPMVRMVSNLPSIGSIASLVILSTGLSIIVILGICIMTRVCKRDEDSVVLNASPTPIPTSAGINNARTRSMKSLLHAYFWRQKVLPCDEERVVKTMSNGNSASAKKSMINSYNGKIQSVVITPITLSSEYSYDSAAALVQNTIRSRRSSQISNKGEEMAPLCIDQDVKSGVADYM